MLPLLADAATKVALRMGVAEKIESVKGTLRLAECRGTSVPYREPRADIATLPARVT